MEKYEREFEKEIAELKSKFEKIETDSNYIYDQENPNGANLIKFRSFETSSVEHTEILNALIVPEWAFNAEFFSEVGANTQFENYYADQKLDYPNNKWKVPVKFVYDYCTYDYDIDKGEKLDNYSEKFISKEEAIKKFKANRKLVEKLLTESHEYKED